MATTKETTLSKRFVPRFWTDLDGRTGIVKEIQARLDDLMEDCKADSAQKRMLAQRAVFIALQLESMEVEAAMTGKLDFGVYVQATNGLSGLLSKLGLERQAKEIQTIQSYVTKNGKNGRNGKSHQGDVKR